MSLRWCAIGVVVASFVAAACAPVKPYERELLAHPAMQQPPSEEVEKDDQHVFEIREGTGGATGASGGGCGCN